jgi:hypothetical protein
MKFAKVFALLLCISLLFSVASAQRLSEVTGTVTDSTGAVLPGVTVVLTDTASGFTKTGITNDLGLYRVIELNPGAYRISAQLAGFKTAVVDVGLETMRITTVDIAMEIGEITESVTVESTGVALEKQSATVSTFLDEKMVESLPQMLKRPLDLVKYAAAVAPRGTWEMLPGYSTAFSMNGVPYKGAEVYIDGGYGMSGRAHDGNADTSPTQHVVKEFRIVQSSFKAEYNGGGGGLIMMSTKTGTNDFHGALWWYHRQKAMDARSYFAPERDPFREHLYGFEVDGPIVKDKVHFMVSREEKRSLTPSGFNITRFKTFPTQAQRQGDFSGKFNSDGTPRIIYDPLTTDANGNRTPFPGNIIPANRISPQSQEILRWLPDADRTPDDPSGTNNFQGVARLGLTSVGWTIRGDWQASDNDKVFVRYISDPIGDESVGSWSAPSFFDSGDLPSDAKLLLDDRNPADPDDWLMTFDAHNQAAGWTHTFSPSLISDFRQTFQYFTQFARNTSQGLGFPQQLGIPVPPQIPSTVDIGGGTGQNDHFPAIGFDGGYNGFGGGWGGGSAINPRTSWHFGDTVTWLRGAHAIKFGVETRRSGHDYFSASRPSGGYNFAARGTAANPFDAASGDAIASLLLDWVDSADITHKTQRNFTASYYGMFVQDDWQVSPNVIVNLGLRYEFDLPMTERNDLISSFDLNLNNPVCNCPGAFIFPTQMYETSKTNIAPRLGIAWNPGGGRTVVRAGAGLYYMQPMIGMNPWQTPSSGRGDIVFQKSLSTPDNGITPAIDGLSAGVGDIPSFELQPGFGAVPIGEAPILSPDYLCCPELRQNPYSINMSFTLQHEINDFVFETGYVGNLVRNLGEWNYNLNQLRPELMGPNAVQVNRPFPQYNDVRQIAVNDKTMTYHAFILKAEKRYAEGLSFISNFTWSKHLGNRAGRFNIYDRKSARGPAVYARRLRFVFAGLYELPFGAGRKYLNSGAAATALGGWDVTAAFIGQSGVALNFMSSPNLTNSFGGESRANLIGNPKGPQTTENWFNVNAFEHPGPFVFGNAGVGILEGPGSADVDFSVAKDFVFMENKRIRFTADFFNFLNHANFNNPSTNICPASAPCTTNLIRSAQPGRRTQLGLQFIF